MSQAPNSPDEARAWVSHSSDLATQKTATFPSEGTIARFPSIRPVASGALATCDEEEAPLLGSIRFEHRSAQDSMDPLPRPPSRTPEIGLLQVRVHPISLCPYEILQLVFEEAVNLSRAPFDVATTLSHVCRHWRNLAISTPRLWRDVVFTLDMQAQATELLASSFNSRVKNIPRVISIFIDTTQLGLGGAIDALHSMPLSLIYGVPVIASLTISIDAEETGQSSILNAITQFPTGPTHHLSLKLAHQNQGPRQLGIFLSNFKGIRHLQACNTFFGETIPPNLGSALGELTTLILQYVFRIPIAELLVLMPGLRELELESCTLLPFPDSAPQITLHELVRFSTFCEGFQWHHLHCHNLFQFQVGPYTLDGSTAKLFNFIATTNSIRDITFESITPHDLAELARLAPQTERLHFEFVDLVDLLPLTDWQGLQLVGSPFPGLRRLQIGCAGKKVRVDLLDNLVRQRCLPRDHPESTMDAGVVKALDEFNVNFWQFPEKWQGSQYLWRYFSRSKDEDGSGDYLGAWVNFAWEMPNTS